MNRTRRGAAGVAALVVGLALTTVVPGSVGRSADAAAVNRAGVVVDPGDGSGPHTACVWFEEDSLTGLELLARSTFDAGIRAFGGLGGAVCSIGGTGCSTDAACLSCGGTQYWAYALADPGASSFSQAPVGAGSRTVTDGAVDGWRWGSGDPPAFRSIDRICPAAPPTTPTAPAPAPPPASAAPPAAVPTRPAPVPAPIAPGVPASQPLAEIPATTGSVPTSTTSTTAPSTTVAPTTAPAGTSTTASTTTVAATPAEPGATIAAAAIPGEGEPTDDGGGTSALGVVAVLLAAGLGGSAFWRMRRAG